MDTDDLFSPAEPAPAAPPNPQAPLATRMRPRTLDEYVGQEHLLAPGKLLRRAIEADRLYSAIFHGPPGTGKTSIAEVIAMATRAKFERLNGVESTVADIRRVIAGAENRQRLNPKARTVLFVDEIHRFNRAQQDALLPDVERGTVRLLGATTENPYFAVNGPLVSRSQVFQLEPLRPEHLRRLMDHALADAERGLGNHNVRLDDDAAEHLATISDGDARKCLNALEVGVLTTRAGGRRCRSHYPGGRRGKHPEKGRRLRPHRRGPLRHDQRVHQEHARLRSRRRRLLAGQDALRG